MSEKIRLRAIPPSEESIYSTVTLNGIVLNDVIDIEVDNETGKGWIERYKRDRYGRLLTSETEIIHVDRGLKLVSKRKQR